MIVFDEESHTYTNTDTQRKYISVTTLLGKYKKQFDSDTHSKRVAEREGVPQEMVLETWKAETKKATDRGTKIHKLMEGFVKYGETNPEYNYLYRSYDTLVQREIGYHKGVQSEKSLVLHDYEVAGTADLIYNRKDDFIIGDFKTNKKYRFNSAFNDYFLEPINHLQYCEFNSYSLQLSLYSFMYEQETGKKCGGIVTFYLEGDKWIPYHSNYLKTDVINLLNDWKKKTGNLIEVNN